MKNRIIKTSSIFVFLLLLNLPNILFAETITFKSGKNIEVDITGFTMGEITAIDKENNALTTYNPTDISHIDGILIWEFFHNNDFSATPIKNNTRILLNILLSIVIIVGVFFLLRKFWYWYFKINRKKI